MDLITIILILWIATSRLCIGGGQKVFNVVDFGAIGDGRTDDSPAFARAWTALCGAEGISSTLEIPVGKTFLLQQVKFQGPCRSIKVHIQVLGNIIAPSSKFGKLCGTECWLCLYDIQNLRVDGSGIIDGNGQSWWSQGQRCNLPRALFFHNCNNLQVKEISIINSPRCHIAINNCNAVLVSNIHINSPENSPNTDGIDISASSHINILDSSIKCGDDCVAINGGTSHINIIGVACGPGHGISVGSLGLDGADDKVEEVHVRYCNFTGTMNGARIKTCPRGSGYARRISFKQITFLDSQNPIIIDQNYPSPGANLRDGSGVLVSDVTYSNVRGTSKGEVAINLECSEKGCFGIKMEAVKIISADAGKGTIALCKNAHGTSTSTAPEVSCLQHVIKD